MKFPLRGVAASMLSAALLSAMLLPAPANAQQRAVGAAGALATERDKVSYMVGMDVGASLRGAGPGLDLAAFERSFRNTLAGGEPLLDEATMKSTMAALTAHANAGQAVPGTPAPAVDWTNAGLAAGIAVGASLLPIKDEIDLDTLMQALRTVLAGQAPRLGQDDYRQVRSAFEQKVMAQARAEAAALGTRNAAEGTAFLAANKGKPGVFTTGSGLQYMVLRDGNGQRPRMEDRVRVHYRGTLLDGTEFDSSYARKVPAEFGLGQVIPGWTEGVSLMPVGAKYRFWIPAELAYGEKGTPGGPIGPDATLVFEVELLEIL